MQRCVQHQRWTKKPFFPFCCCCCCCHRDCHSHSHSFFLSFFGSFFIVVPQPPSQQILFFSPSPVSPEKNGAAVVVKFFLFPVNDWKSSKVLEEKRREREIKKTNFSGGDEKPKNRLFHQNVTHFADCFDVESFRSVSHLQIAETSSCSSGHQRRSNSLPSVVRSIYSCRCASKTKPWLFLQ